MSVVPSPAQLDSAAAKPIRRLKLSANRLAANRLNALKSTGPRTPEGKARSAQNARKSTGPRTPAGKARAARNARTHGVWCGESIRPEDRADFSRHVGKVLAHHRLQTPVELYWGVALAYTEWMLARVEQRLDEAGLPDIPGRKTLDVLTGCSDTWIRLSGRLLTLLRWRMRGLDAARIAALPCLAAGLAALREQQLADDEVLRNRSEATAAGSSAESK